MGMPVFKHTIAKFKEIIEEGAEAASKILKYDPTIAFLLISEANRLPQTRELTSFSQITSFLGSRKIENIILQRDLVLEEEDMQIWVYGILSAEIASLISERLPHIHRDEAFFAGLVPCLSLLFIMNEFPKYRRIMNFLIKLPLEDRVYIEDSVLGTNNLEAAQRNILNPQIYRNLINYLNRIFKKGQKLFKESEPPKGSELQVAYDLALISDLSAYGAQALLFPSVVDNRELFLELSKRYFYIPENESLEILQNAMDRFIGVAEQFGVAEELRFSSETLYEMKRFKFKSKNPVFARMIDELFKENAKDRNIYIYGESAVGKRLLAAALHSAPDNPRGDKPFVMIFSDIDSQSLEEEFFGIKDGYMGKKGKRGVLRIADGGTLVIKEFDRMPREFQDKFENALKNKKFYRLGEVDSVEFSSIRFILVGKEDIRVKVAKGEFSSSLIRFLNPVFFKILPLRERREDVFYIAEEILKKYKLPIEDKLREPSVIEKLKNDPLPNNLRDLKRILFIMHVKRLLKS